MACKNKDRVRVVIDPYSRNEVLSIDKDWVNTIQFQLPNGNHIDISLTVEEGALVINSTMDTMIVEPRAANVIRIKSRR